MHSSSRKGTISIYIRIWKEKGLLRSIPAVIPLSGIEVQLKLRGWSQPKTRSKWPPSLPQGRSSLPLPLEHLTLRALFRIAPVVTLRIYSKENAPHTKGWPSSSCFRRYRQRDPKLNIKSAPFPVMEGLLYFLFSCLLNFWRLRIATRRVEPLSERLSLTSPFDLALP